MRTTIQPPQKNIVVVGSMNVDFVVRADHLPAPGESVVGHEFFQAFGGKGANQAVGIARLGVEKVTFVGAVGDDDLGESCIKSLTQENIETEFVRSIADVKCGVALIMIDAKGENCITAAPGANAFVDESYVESLPDRLFQNSDLVVVCQEIPLEAIAILFQKANQFSRPVLFNPAPPNPRLKGAELLHQVDYLTPNETEVAALTDIQIESVDDVDRKTQAMQRLIEMGAKNVAITMGSAGCFVYESTSMSAATNAIQIPAPPTDAVDTTAAGDSFNAALATALVEGQPFLEACRWANQVAALSVMTKGAQPSLPRRSDCRFGD